MKAEIFIISSSVVSHKDHYASIRKRYHFVADISFVRNGKKRQYVGKKVLVGTCEWNISHKVVQSENNFRERFI